jgi:Putative prokaryotic signal transducing protein
MKELLRSADLVRMSFLEALLAEAGIEAMVLDRNMNATWGDAFPPRLMVDDADYAQARRLLVQAGEIANEAPR